MRRTPLAAPTLVMSAAVLAGCVPGLKPRAPVPPSPQVAATFSVPDSELGRPLVLVAYGDMRFTDPAETLPSRAAARQALVAKVAAEHPAAIFINGDLPHHGTPQDYGVYHDETAAWREQHLRVYPALGNHEFSQCAEAACLELWWSAFPELRGRRWYSVAVGSKVLSITLDSDTSLFPGSEQRAWLETQVSTLNTEVQFVLISLHHPPVADIQSVKYVDHNPRANEQALAEYLSSVASNAHARFVVSAGHIHNYERFERDGVVYLVSGGGGARPYEVDRTALDLYQDRAFPNYHYVRFELQGSRLVAQMIRLSDYAADRPSHWKIKDRFELSPRP
jgi:hypothetical protein